MTFRSTTLSIMLFALFSCSTSSVTELVGEWQGEGNEGISFTYIFSEDGSLTIVDGTQVMDGKSLGGTLRWEYYEAEQDDTGEYSKLAIIANGAKIKKTKYKWIKAVSEKKLEIGLGDINTKDERSFAILTKQ